MRAPRLRDTAKSPRGISFTATFPLPPFALLPPPLRRRTLDRTVSRREGYRTEERPSKFRALSANSNLTLRPLVESRGSRYQRAERSFLPRDTPLGAMMATFCSNTKYGRGRCVEGGGGLILVGGRPRVRLRGV